MTPRQPNNLTAVGKILKVVADASQDLKHLNELSDPDSKAQAATLCKAKLLQSASALEQLVKQHGLPVPDAFWYQTVEGVPLSADVDSGPAAVDERMQMKFTAKYPGECPAGDGEIEGTRVVKTNLDRLWHEQCWALEASK
jgi:hypothetical protein